LEHFPVEVQWFKKIHRRPLLGRPAVGLAMGIGGVVIGLVFLALGRSSRRG
jgi:hypothetical protein